MWKIPHALFFHYQRRTGCESGQIESEVTTGVELSEFHVLQYVNLLLSPVLFHSVQMGRVCFGSQLRWTWVQRSSDNLFNTLEALLLILWFTPLFIS